MKDEYYWSLFERTGNIEDYLNYACTSEESLMKDRVATHCTGTRESRVRMMGKEIQNIT